MAEIDWAKLSAPIPAEHIKQVNKGYGNRSYVDAPALMERLDDVLGPDGWMEDTTVEWHGDYPSAKCKLSIAVNGDWITKSGMGGPNNVGRSTSDSGRVNSEGKPLKDGRLYVEDEEPDKSAASDAFRRACRTWGIGRELWLGAKGTQTSQEGRSTPATGDDDPQGKCPVHDVPWRHNVSTQPGKVWDFWACPHYDEVKGKRVYCKEKPPLTEDESILDNEPPAEGTAGDPAHPDPRAVTVMDILRAQGKETPGQQMAALARATQAAGLNLPRGSKPEKWLSSLGDEDLSKIVDALDAQVTE